jgi:hypothetical protein
MKHKVIMLDGLPNECPSCEGTDLCIDNCEGMECMECGVWFDCAEDGTVLFMRANRPFDIDG